MNATARDFNQTQPTDVNGMDDLFDVEVAEVLAVDGPEMDEGHMVSLTEAADKLGITRRSALRLLQEGKLAGAREGQGPWLVKMTSIEARIQSKSAISSQPMPVAEPVAVGMAEDQGESRPEGHDEGQAQIMRELLLKVEALTYRNGYLEAQLEAERQQVKLLTDSQLKPKWWRHFWTWGKRG